MASINPLLEGEILGSKMNGDERPFDVQPSDDNVPF